MTIITEADFEQVALEWLSGVGWQVAHGRDWRAAEAPYPAEPPWLPPEGEPVSMVRPPEREYNPSSGVVRRCRSQASPTIP